MSAIAANSAISTQVPRHPANINWPNLLERGVEAVILVYLGAPGSVEAIELDVGSDCTADQTLKAPIETSTVEFRFISITVVDVVKVKVKMVPPGDTLSYLRQYHAGAIV